jgi:hypothetical protein
MHAPWPGPATGRPVHIADGPCNGLYLHKFVINSEYFTTASLYHCQCRSSKYAKGARSYEDEMEPDATNTDVDALVE